MLVPTNRERSKRQNRALIVAERGGGNGSRDVAAQHGHFDYNRASRTSLKARLISDGSSPEELEGAGATGTRTREVADK